MCQLFGSEHRHVTASSFIRARLEQGRPEIVRVEMGEGGEGGCRIQFGQQFEPTGGDGGDPVLQLLEPVGVVEIPGADGIDEVMHERVGSHAEAVHDGGRLLQRAGRPAVLLQQRSAELCQIRGEPVGSPLQIAEHRAERSN
jgi:hypothetical protein